MKARPNYLLVISILVILGIVWFRFDQYVEQRNFTTVANVPCSAEEGTCFIADCSPEEDDECDVSPYKKIEILASEAPTCLEEHTCEAFACATDSCTETFCSDEALEDGEVCAVGEVVEEAVTEEPAEEALVQ